MNPSSGFPLLARGQEAYRSDLVDFGPELDGVEGIHCLENNPLTAILDEIGFRADDYFIRKRRYSAFFGTYPAILLEGLKAETLILIGGLTVKGRVKPVLPHFW